MQSIRQNRPNVLIAVILGLALTAGLFVPATRAAAELTEATTIEGITEYNMPNGLKVLLFPDDSKPTVTVNITYFVGSRHEGYGETGMAHLLEHMLFKGTPTFPDIDKELTGHGAQMNGTTWVDRTNYFETMPASDENLEFGLKLEADRMVNSFIAKKDLDSEMTVVRNEFERGENDPVRSVLQGVMSAAFRWHNYGKPTIGNRSDIERVPIDNLQAFYKKYYRPDNAMLVLAGKFDEQKAKAYINQYFGPLTNPDTPLSNTYTEEPAQDGERRLTIRRVGDIDMLGIGFHVPAGPHPDQAAIEVMEDILTARPSGLLYQSLVDSGKAAAIFGYAPGWHDPALFMLFAQAPPEGSLDDIENTMIDTLAKLADQGVTDEQVQRSIQRYTKYREDLMSDSQEVAIELSEWAAMGDWRMFFLHRDRIENVTADDVQRIANAYLTEDNRTVGRFEPTDQPKRVTIPATPNVAELVSGYEGREAIAQGEVFDPSPENIQQRTTIRELPGGVKAALLPKKTRGESVVLTLTLRYGDAENLKAVNYASEYLPQLMTRATKNLSREQLQDALDANQTSIGASGGSGVMSFTVQTKRPFLPAALDLLRQVLREPLLPTEDFENMKRESLAALEESRTQPDALALNYIRRAVGPYPADDIRYTPTIDEQIANTRALTVEDVRKVYTDYAGGEIGELAVVGDFDTEPLIESIAATLSGWESPVNYEHVPLLVPDNLQATLHNIETPDKANAFYFSATVIPMSTSHPDYPALMLANQVFGGTFASRLVDRIRQREGLSYGVRASLGAQEVDERTSFNMYAITNPVNMQRVHEAMRDELSKMLVGPISPDELERERGNYLQQQVLTRSNDAALAGILKTNLYVGRDMSWWAEFESHVADLTADQVHAAFAKHIHPDKLITAQAGDFANADEAARTNTPAGGN